MVGVNHAATSCSPGRCLDPGAALWLPGGGCRLGRTGAAGSATGPWGGGLASDPVSAEPNFSSEIIYM